MTVPVMINGAIYTDLPFQLRKGEGDNMFYLYVVVNSAVILVKKYQTKALRDSDYDTIKSCSNGFVNFDNVEESKRGGGGGGEIDIETATDEEVEKLLSGG